LNQAFEEGGSISIKHPSDWSDEEVDREVGQITCQFDLLECADCARSVIGWLRDRGIEGKILRLRTRYGEDYILSDRLGEQGIYESITVNGQHFAVEVRGKVFDNLSAQGLSRDDWLKDFHCHSDLFVMTELENL